MGTFSPCARIRIGAGVMDIFLVSAVCCSALIRSFPSCHGAMRTCVRVPARPWKPSVELDGALARGDLAYAMTLASEVAEDRGRPIDLDTALRFLPLVGAQQPEHYDAWALRWLARWSTESAATIERAAEVAAQLADLPSEPTALDTIRKVSRSS
jgi:hypothetical protein